MRRKEAEVQVCKKNALTQEVVWSYTGSYTAVKRGIRQGADNMIRGSGKTDRDQNN